MRESKHYNAGIYCRLSKDDERQGDSVSILSQKTMLEKVVAQNSWTVYDTYIDDGYSGTNFDRPDFRRLINDIEDGNVDLVIVKDLSRLGRDYLAMGYYTEVFFPTKGVRFIAVNNGVDSLNQQASDFTPFLNIVNEMYSRDLSKKVKSAVQTKKEKGEFLSNRAPIGYAKDPKDKNKLVIEKSGAEVVRRIYDLCISGMGTCRIAQTLNANDVPSPRNHHEIVCPDYYKTPQRKFKWSPETVHNILRSRIYRGDMVQGIYDCARFKRTPNKRKPREEWIITPNTHEPLIAPETWDHVQKCLDTRKRVIRSNELQLFAGFIKCKDCGYALAYARRYGTEYYSCGHYRRNGLEYCTQHYINKQLLMDIVLNDIRHYAKLAKDRQETLAAQLARQHGQDNDKQVKAMRRDLAAAKKRYTDLDIIIENLYEDNVTGKLTDNRFMKLSRKYEDEQSALEKQIAETEQALAQISEHKQDFTQWLKLIRKHTNIENLDRIVLSELVEKITVGEATVVDGEKQFDVDIYYRFVGSIRL